MKLTFTNLGCIAAMAITAVAADASTILYQEGGAISAGAGFDVDVNKDGINDITLRENAGSGFAYIGAYGRGGTQLSYGNAFNGGDLIGPGLATTRAVALTGYYDFTFRGRRVNDTFGAWDDNTTNTQTGFLGFRLGTGQYGWVELALSPLGTDLGVESQLLSFGFETEVGVAIEAGAETEIIPNPLPASAWLIGASILGLGALGRMKKRTS